MSIPHGIEVIQGRYCMPEDGEDDVQHPVA